MNDESKSPIKLNPDEHKRAMYIAELMHWSGRWSLDGDLVRCKTCGAGQHVTYSDKSFEHKKSCGWRNSVEVPWLTLNMAVSNSVGKIKLEIAYV